MNRNFGKALLALSIGLTMVGCSKAPTTVSPSKDSNLGTLQPSSDQVCPNPTPVVPPVVLPTCQFIAFTSFIGGHFKLFLYDDILKDNYALPGAGEDINNPMFYAGGNILFDRDGCILVYNMQNETICYLDDINSAGCFDCYGNRPYLARPSASWDGKRVVFIADELGRHRNEWLRGCGFNEGFCDLFDGIAGRVFLWECGPCSSVCELAKINAVACAHGGVTWVDISADGRWIVFTTGDGQLWIYDILNPMVCLIADAMDIGSQCGWGRDNFVYLLQPSISATGKQIVFAAVTMDDCGFVRSSIWRYDRILGCLDPMPFANAALNADRLCLEFCDRDYDRACGCDKAHQYDERGMRTDEGECDECDRGHRFNRIRGIGGVILNPRFLCYDEENIYYEALVPGLCEGTVRAFEVLNYNWVTETVRTLSILNNVVATDVVNLISDLYGPYYCVDTCDYCERDCDKDHEHHYRNGDAE